MALLTLLPLRTQRTTSWSYFCSSAVRSPMISSAREMYCFRISMLCCFSASPLHPHSLAHFQHLLPVQLNHISCRVVGALSAINATQQPGSDVPVLPAFGNNCYCLFVVAREHTNLHRPAFRLKRNTITEPELQHLGVSPHVIQKFQPLDNAVVKID